MAAKKRIVIIGAGLCGSVLSALLRNAFDVTVVEQGRKKRPLFNEVDCASGGINSSINRAEGLGGTTNYWHNALIELTDSDLQHAGIDSSLFGEYYAKAWSLFLSDDQKRECEKIRKANSTGMESGSCTIGHMVVPYAPPNAWNLANARYPGDAVRVVFGTADRIVPREGRSGHLIVKGSDGEARLDADYFLVCAGGLATPVLLSNSIHAEGGFCHGYHDHPMAYLAKVKLRPDSFLKSHSCKQTQSADVRAGYVFETGGMKAVFYLRPAMNMGLRSITGSARYILSVLRVNAPFSLKKILQLLTNPDAIKEAVLFKTKAGFRGDYYSVLMLGEQIPVASRGIATARGKTPSLNWHVTPNEHEMYQRSFDCFMKEFSSEIVDSRVIAPAQWEYRTAAHHSGSASDFLATSQTLDQSFFAVKELPSSFVCDASLLRAGGIANSGLTLVALCHRLAEIFMAGN